MECLNPTVSFDLFIDNYFTSFSLFVLLTHLEVNNIRARGVFNKKRLRKYTIMEANNSKERNVATLNSVAHIKQKRCVTCVAD